MGGKKNWLGPAKPRKGNTRSHPARSDMARGVILEKGQVALPGSRLGAIEDRVKQLEVRVSEERIFELERRILLIERRSWQVTPPNTMTIVHLWTDNTFTATRCGAKQNTDPRMRGPFLLCKRCDALADADQPKAAR